MCVCYILQAIRSDACRSMSARLQAMCEDEDGGSSEQLPVRASLSISSCRQFQWTDYLLPGDTVQVCTCIIIVLEERNTIGKLHFEHFFFIKSIII